MPLCTEPRCTNQQAFVPVVNVPATGVERGGGIPLQATLTGRARCRDCINRLTLAQLLTPDVKHMMTLTVQDGEPAPDWNRAWLTKLDVHSPKLAQLRMKASQGGHA